MLLPQDRVHTHPLIGCPLTGTVLTEPCRHLLRPLDLPPDHAPWDQPSPLRHGQQGEEESRMPRDAFLSVAPSRLPADRTFSP